MDMSDTVVFRESAQQLTRKDVSATEEKLGVSFPVAYRTMLLAHNGGRPKPASFVFPLHEGGTLAIERLLSIDCDDAADDVAVVTDELRKALDLPKAFVAIARLENEDPDDDPCFIVLDTSRRANGRMCLAEPADERFDDDVTLYFPIDQLLQKLGNKTLASRRDADAIYVRLAKAAAEGRPKAIKKLLNESDYDVNYVLPGWRHPVFEALDWDQYACILEFVEAGTHGEHLDTQHNDKSLIESLRDALEQYSADLREFPKSDVFYKNVAKHLKPIQASLVILEAAGGC